MEGERTETVKVCSTSHRRPLGPIFLPNFFFLLCIQTHSKMIPLLWKWREGGKKRPNNILIVDAFFPRSIRKGEEEKRRNRIVSYLRAHFALVFATSSGRRRHLDAVEGRHERRRRRLLRRRRWAARRCRRRSRRMLQLLLLLLLKLLLLKLMVRVLTDDADDAIKAHLLLLLLM